MSVQKDLLRVRFAAMVIVDETLAKAYHLSKANEKDSFFFGEQEVSIAGKSLEELQKENHNKDRQMLALNGVQRIFELTRMRVINDVVPAGALFSECS